MVVSHILKAQGESLPVFTHPHMDINFTFLQWVHDEVIF